MNHNTARSTILNRASCITAGALLLHGACSLGSDEFGGQVYQAEAQLTNPPLTKTGSPNYRRMVTAGFRNRTRLRETLIRMTNENEDIDAMACNARGDWIIVAGRNYVASDGLAAPLQRRVAQYLTWGRRVDVIAFAPNGAWVVVANDLHSRSVGVARGQELDQKLRERRDAGRPITDIALTSEGWSIVSGGWATSTGQSRKMYRAIRERRPGRRRIQVTERAASDGRFVVVADQWTATDNIGSSLQNSLAITQRLARRIDHLMLGPDGSYVLFSNGRYEPNADDPMAAIEYGLQGGTRNIWQRMAATNVNGVSVAVVDNNQVQYARGYGVLRAGEQDFVRASSPFDAASLSKMVGAMVNLNVADDGFVDIDESLNDFADRHSGGTLDWWRGSMQSSPEVYDVDDIPLSDRVTVRRLLSNTAGLVPHVSTSFLASRWPSTAPITLQLLLGFHCDSATRCEVGDGRAVWHDASIDTATMPDGAPGFEYDYAGGGFFLADAVSEDATGSSFETLADARLFNQLGLQDATFRHPLPNRIEARAAWPHNTNGQARPQRRHYPWHSAGGLFASARDYAEIAIVLLNEGRGSNGTRILRQASTRAMLRDHAPAGNRYGFGLGLSRSQVDESGGSFFHTGLHINRARSRMIGNPSRNQAIVIMVNGGESGDDGDTAISDFVGEIGTAFRCAYGWISC